MKTSKPDIAAILKDTELVTAALRRAVREDLRRHVAEGLPIAEWIDGKMVWTPPEEIEAYLKSDDAEP